MRARTAGRVAAALALLGLAACGGGDGGTDLVQIAGAIVGTDYPANLGSAGSGKRVSTSFVVAPTGRVTHCTVTQSSGIPQLDTLTCRLIIERFRFRPSTDARGRPIEDEVDYDQRWSVRR